MCCLNHFMDMAPDLKTRFRMELACDYEQWWRYNVYIMAVGFDEEGGAGTFNNLVDKVLDANFGGEPRTSPPEGYKTPRTISLTTQECAFAEVYIYVVANTFPPTDVISEWPPFPVTLRVTADGRTIEEKTYEVNQWGGLTVVAHRISAV